MNCDPDRTKYIVSQARRFLTKHPHWNNGDIAKSACIPRATLYSWLAGTRQPKTLAHIEALERFLKSKGYAK